MGQIKTALNIGIWGKSVKKKNKLYWSKFFRLEDDEDQSEGDDRVC